MTNTQEIEQTRGGKLIADLGMVLSDSGCDLVECELALAFMAGEVLAQQTDRVFSEDSLATALLVVADAYQTHCTSGVSGNVAPTIN